MNMVPRWTLAAAFAAGLVPGLLLYFAHRAQSVAPAAVAPTAIAVPAPVAAPTATTPAASPPPAARDLKRAPAQAAPRESDGHLRTERDDALARLAASEKSAAEAQAKLRELEPRLASLVEQQQAAQSQEKELRLQLETVQRQLATVEANHKSRDAKLAELELAHSRLQRQGTDAGQRLQRVTELVAELEENGRRRESYLNSILGRYREATDLFRAMSLRLDNPRDVATPLNNDLSRIQAAIQSADEDLRQLRTLNAQAAKMQRELAARR